MDAVDFDVIKKNNFLFFVFVGMKVKYRRTRFLFILLLFCGRFVNLYELYIVMHVTYRRNALNYRDMILLSYRPHHATYSLFPFSHSDAGQSRVSMSSGMWKRAVSAFLRGCYAAL